MPGGLRRHARIGRTGARARKAAGGCSRPRSSAAGRRMAKDGPAAPGAVKTITSLANPMVKEIRGLALPKNRKASGLFVAEGLKLVADALEAGWPIRTLVHAARVADQPLVRARRRRRACPRRPRSCRSARRCWPRSRGATIRRWSSACSSSGSRRSSAIGRKGDDRLGGAGGGRAIPAISARSCGPSTRSAPRASILIGDTVDPFSVEAVRATMGSIFQSPLARATLARFRKLRRALAGPGRRHASLRQGRLSQGGLSRAGAAADGQ